MGRRKVVPTVGLVLAALVLAVFAALGFYDALNSTGNGLHFRIVGKTTDVRYYGGTLRAVSSGFTPEGSYTTMVWRPNGQPYQGVQGGLVDAYGQVSNWSWNAGGTYYYGSVDSPGRYKVVVIDDATGRATKPVYFTVNPPPAVSKKKS